MATNIGGETSRGQFFSRPVEVDLGYKVASSVEL